LAAVNSVVAHLQFVSNSVVVISNNQTVLRECKPQPAPRSQPKVIRGSNPD